MADTERHVRPFAEMLVEQSNGRTHAEMSEQLHQLLEAVALTGKGGSIKLEIIVKPATKGARDTVVVSDKITTKLPPADRADSIFYIDRSGNLTRRNPNQPELPLRVAGTDAPQDPKEARA